VKTTVAVKVTPRAMPMADPAKIALMAGKAIKAPPAGQSWITSIEPPAGYSANGLAKAVMGGCAVGGAINGGLTLVSAPFTAGASTLAVPAATFSGCMGGAGTSIFQYALIGDASWSQDTSIMEDIRSFFHGL
jgi:hypothetical protein